MVCGGRTIFEVLFFLQVSPFLEVMLSVKIIFLNLGLRKSYVWNAMPLSLEPPENVGMVVVGGCDGVLMYI